MSATASGVPAGAARRQPLQLPLGLLDHHRVEQLAQLGLAEQLGEQRRVQRERLGAPLGQRRVALVHERADVAEQQRPAERRRGRRLDLDEPDPARRDVAHQRDQAGHVEHVLQALPHRLQHDRERAVLAGHRQQLRGPLALLPQRRAAAGLAPRQQQRPGRALPEPGGEQRRRAELGRHQLLDLVRVEHRRCRPAAGRPRPAPGSRCRRRCASPARPCRRTARAAGPRSPAPTARAPGRRTGCAAPAASRRARPGTARARGSGRPAGSRSPRAARSGRRPGSPRPARPARRRRSRAAAWPRAGRAELAAERADRRAELGRAARRVAVPERQPAGLARARGRRAPGRR